jgi:hypothetical protein
MIFSVLFLVPMTPMTIPCQTNSCMTKILTIFLAGHETAALSLTWAAYLLATHPEMQEQAAEEVFTVTGGGDVRAEHYPHLRFVTAVAKEALRLYPPVWSLGRVATKDTALGSLPVVKGTDMWLCLHRLHRDPRWYPEPDRFRPERWLGNQAQRPFTYAPFGVGPRVCIGQHFAMAVPEGPYLAIAKKQADHMLEWQNPEDYWPFIATKTVEETGISEKGTALWSYLLYELYRSTHEQKYLDAARKALAWCIRNQYFGPDSEAFGGLVGTTQHSAVGYRQFFPVSCGYTSGFFGMAVVDELEIQGTVLPRTKIKREAANRAFGSNKGTHGPS